jgi:hypothetical protein
MTATNHESAGTSTAADLPPDIGGPRASTAFRIVSWVVGLGTVALWVFGLMEPVLMWLSDETLLSLFEEGEPTEIENYRSQFFHIGIAVWAVVPSVLVQLRRPERRVAPLMQMWFGAIALVVVMAIVGGLEPIDFVLLAAFTLLAALHPARREMFRRTGVDRAQLGVLAVGAVPWLVRAGVAIGDAWDAKDLPDVDGTPALMIEGNVALAVVLVLLAAAIGATRHSGWKLLAWTAALSPIGIGVHALVFDDQAASVSAPWAVAAVGWGIAYAAATVGRLRRADATV